MPESWTLDVRNALADVIGPRGTTTATLAALAPAAEAAERRLDERRRAGEIGFSALPFDPAPLDAVETFVAGIDRRITDVLVAGIGGSSLGPRALCRALTHRWNELLPAAQRPGRRLWFLENADPDTVAATLDVVDLRRALVVVITKSGGTAETLAQWLVAWERMAKAVGARQVASRFVFVTDPQRGVLRQVAAARNVASFAVPPDVGGRFSVFTPVGLLPAALAGIDVRSLMSGAAAAATACRRPAMSANPARLLAALHVAALRAGRPIHVLMPYADRLRDAADWFRQLWAESLGKRVDRSGAVVEVGPTPVAALGAVDQHSQVQLYAEGPHDKLITFLAVRDPGPDVRIPKLFAQHPETAYLGGATIGGLLDAERRATAAALARAGRPNLTITLSAVTPATMGALFQIFEETTALAGTMMDIDPFDQPGVEEGKKLTFGLMGRPGFEDRKTALEQWEKKEVPDATVAVDLPAAPAPGPAAHAGTRLNLLRSRPRRGSR
ncbi:MAG: glucose-6-phosphate isomerase [Deltaproteobacteria bacterium]|nr:glucose-6-phosphate isomerase [Deltaproteobacteria bacterium]